MLIGVPNRNIYNDIKFTWLSYRLHETIKKTLAVAKLLLSSKSIEMFATIYILDPARS